MSRRIPSIAIAGLMMVGLLSSCATTKLTSTWMDPTAKDVKLATVMVIGVAKQDMRRRQYEDSFVAQLATRKVNAVASYKYLPDPAAITKETAAQVVIDQKVTQVLVTRLVDVQTVQNYVPPTSTVVGGGYPGYYGNWYGYYGSSYQVVSSPGYTYDTTYMTLESNIYDVSSEKLVWSGRTQTEMGSNLDGQIPEFIAVLMGGMTKSGLIK